MTPGTAIASAMIPLDGMAKTEYHRKENAGKFCNILVFVNESFFPHTYLFHIPAL